MCRCWCYQDWGGAVCGWAFEVEVEPLYRRCVIEKAANGIVWHCISHELWALRILMISRVSCFILLFLCSGLFFQRTDLSGGIGKGMKQTNKSFSLKNVINLIGNLLLVDAVDGRERSWNIFITPIVTRSFVVGFPRIYLVRDHYPQLFDYPDEIRHNGLETVAWQQIDEIDAGSLPFEWLAFHSSSHLRSQ